jgi:hypothetical protein
MRYGSYRLLLHRFALHLGLPRERTSCGACRWKCLSQRTSGTIKRKPSCSRTMGCRRSNARKPPRTSTAALAVLTRLIPLAEQPKDLAGKDLCAVCFTVHHDWPPC